MRYPLDMMARESLRAATVVLEARMIGAPILATRYTAEQVKRILDATYDTACATGWPNTEMFYHLVSSGRFAVPADITGEE